MVKQYRVGKDGQGQLVDEQQVVNQASEAPDGSDLSPVVSALVQMAHDVQTTFNSIPNRGEAQFNAGARQALLNAGNALDYVFRLVEEVRREQNILRLRRELDEETKGFVTTPEPAAPPPFPPGFPSPHVTLTEEKG